MTGVRTERWEDLGSLDEELAAGWDRVQAIVAGGLLTDDLLVELTAIYNNVAYAFLYLEANVEYVGYDHLAPWLERFHGDADLDRKLLKMLEALQCDDAEAEDARRAYLDQLIAKRDNPEDNQEIDAHLAEAKDVLGKVDADLDALLDRLGSPSGGVNAWAVMYKLSSSSERASTRAKLASAWYAARDRRLDDLVDSVDAMVEARRRQAAAEGRGSVLEKTFVKCRVDPTSVRSFVDRYAESALAASRALEEEVAAELDLDPLVDRPLDHFGRYLARRSEGAAPPTFHLGDCLAFIWEVAGQVFGIEVSATTPPRPHVLRAEVSEAGVPVGAITFDLWDLGARGVGANHTIGLRNRTDWGELVQLPRAHVSCRFRVDRAGTDRITFQNVHSLFHEFGHALNHLLMRRRISNRSGLEYLPLERVEHLSMWFEKWAYHPGFGSFLAARAADRGDPGVAGLVEGTERCQQIKRLEFRRTYVERATSALLDFEVHRRSAGGLRDVWSELDERFGVGRHCRFGDFPVFFTWPMYVANPGSNFAYLFGSAFSCEQFAPYRDLGVDASAPALAADGRQRFAECLDFNLPSAVPDSVHVFEFYAAHPTDRSLELAP